jgi:signal peptidase I
MNDARRIRLLLDEYGFAPCVEVGECMEPSICRGEKMLVEKVVASDVKAGDVIVFKRGQMLHAHRVYGRVRVGGGVYFATRGDREKEFDKPVSEKVFYGRVVGKHRSVRELSTVVVSSLLAVYYSNKKIGWRIPAYRFFSLLVRQLT